MPTNGNVVRGIGEVVAGSVLGSLFLRVLGLSTLGARITNLERVVESQHTEIVQRLAAIESALMKK